MFARYTKSRIYANLHFFELVASRLKSIDFGNTKGVPTTLKHHKKQ